MWWLSTTITLKQEKENMNERMNESQRLFGIAQLKILAEHLGLSMDKTVEMIHKVNDIRDFYQWVNADEFVTEWLFSKDEAARALYDSHIEQHWRWLSFILRHQFNQGEQNEMES